ncbi:E3 ubiquitin-protein ligase RNF26 [Coregonus clupeaformis]|uniref:E3 ubiquitin-protein ligase RNF26 n=1 Tax=Coregonus clupeaformis TaxID=59861 RepID=UPI001BDF8B55|nr:E3 ubiquitin-protein ligase RNF26 [Coregonus clupeaformis]
MGLVNLVFCTIGKCFNFISFLLDLNFLIVHSVIWLLTACITFVNNLPMLLTHSMVKCWNFTVFCMVAMMDSVSLLAKGTVNMLGRWLHLVGGVLESFKMVGYLSSHVLLRVRDLFHRGLLCGHCLLQQVWEGCGIAVSLVFYLVNTVVNLLLIGTQNVYSVVVSMWEAVSCPLQKAVELTLTLFTFLYSSLVGTSVVLWTPIRLALEFLGSLGHIFGSVFLLNIYGLILTATIFVTATIYMNPELTRLGARRAVGYVNSVPTLHLLQRALNRLYMLERGVWQRLQQQGSRLHQTITPVYRNIRVRGDGHARQPEPSNREQGALTDGRAGDAAPHPEHAARQRQLIDDLWDLAFPSSSSTNRPLQKLSSGEGGSSSKGPPTDSLLTLLKEQEERKKCVICQDSTKTVVLLPCRHLCLCRDCTNILLRQPIYQQNCPLCRHMILNTMDVYL